MRICETALRIAHERAENPRFGSIWNSERRGIVVRDVAANDVALVVARR